MFKSGMAVGAFEPDVLRYFTILGAQPAHYSCDHLRQPGNYEFLYLAQMPLFPFVS